MANMMTLEVVSPERLVLYTPAEYVSLPSIEGLYGILPRHAPMLVALKTGVVHYRDGGARRGVAIRGGFAEVSYAKVVVLAEHAELPEDIDVVEAERQRAEARAIIEAGGDQAEVKLARERLEVALTRLRTAKNE